MADAPDTTEMTATNDTTDARGVGGNQSAIGALVGLAVGDALGAPFEFQEPGLYREANPAPRLGGRGEMRGGGTFAWRPGEFTDDTQMALALAESLIACRGFDPADVWARWRHWAGGARDVGVQTGTVLQSADHNGAAAALHEANCGRTAGNGSVMRNTPIGLWAASRSLEELVGLATAQATLTHHDRHNGYAASIHAAMIRAGIRGEDVFAAIDEVLDLLPVEARERWAPLLSADYAAEAGASNGDVFTCLAQAVWAVRGATSFEDAVVRAVELGRDTDTVAAVAGSIAGARWGIQAIPSRWTTYLNGRVSRPRGDDVYDYWALQTVARALIGKG
ncbi:MAG: ADP-ribosylglycohydrolase family protein, partial [Actinomycetota bacterium]